MKSAKTPLATETVLARVVKKAKGKGAATWNVLEPLEHLGFADKVTALAQLFADGSLGARHQVAIDAAAQALRLMMSSDGDARPRGLTGATTKLLASLAAARADAPGMFPGYSHGLDAMVMWAYAIEPAPLDALAGSLEGPARLGLASVRFRFGHDVPEAMRPALVEGLARTDGDHVTRWHTLLATPAGLEVASDDELEALALRLGDQESWRAALAAAAGEARPLRAWLVPRLDAAHLARTIGSLSDQALERLDDDTIGALLAHPGSAEAFASALQSVPDTAKIGKTLLGIVTGAKLADAGLPIPSPWPLFRSYDGFSDLVAKRLLVRALLRIHAAFPAARSHAYVRNALGARFPDVLVALAVHPEPELLASALALFGETEHPEARGVLLARHGDPMPEGRQLRLDYLLARCEAVPAGKRDPRWLEAVDPQGEVEALGDWEVVWVEARILLAFPAARRAAVVLPALRGEGDKAHAIRLLRVLDEGDARKGLAAALASAKPPPPNWLDWALRLGSFPEVGKPWTRETLLGPADGALSVRYREYMY